MTTANIEKFYEVATTDPTIAKALIAGAQTPADVLQRAADKAGEHGLTFTAAEAEAWVDAQRAAKANGELTDFQLEQVAGGKGGSSAASTADSVVEGIDNGLVEPLIETSIDAMETVADEVSDWVYSW